MKSVIRLAFHILLFTFIRSNSSADEVADYRPALLGNGRRSLINMIDTQSLMKRGQGDAVIMFGCAVTATGRGGLMEVYRCSPNSDLLQKEAMGRCWQSDFIPAIYHHQRVDVWISGTIVFFIKDGKPHLRIFLNQEHPDLTSGNDFIAPQFAFVSGNTKFKGFEYPPDSPGHEAVVSLAMDCDTSGKVSNVKITYEYPPTLGFGRQLAGPILDAAFIPGFRNGKPVACRFTTTFISWGTRRQKMKTG